MRPGFDGLDGFFGERFGADEPLRGDERLDDGFAAVAFAEVEGVVLDLLEEAAAFEVGDHAFAGFEAVEARVWTAVGSDVRRVRR